MWPIKDVKPLRNKMLLEKFAQLLFISRVLKAA